MITGNLEGLDPFLVLALKRFNLSFDLHVTSGLREPSSPDDRSSHIVGLAVDIACDDSSKRYELLNAALANGFARVGIYPTHIHLDIDHEKSSCVVWLGP